MSLVRQCIDIYNQSNMISVVNFYVDKIMLITDLDSMQQAIANIKLEGLTVSEELQLLLYKALSEGKLTTTDIINSIMNG